MPIIIGYILMERTKQANKLINDALNSNVKRNSQRFGKVVEYYTDKWNSIYNSQFKDTKKLHELKNEFYSLREFIKEDTIDRLWMRVISGDLLVL